MTTPDSRKLLLGSLLIGASAFPLGGVLSGVLAGVGGNWLSEALGSVVSAGPPPDAALRAAFVRAVQRAASDLRNVYGVERVQRDGADAFDLVRQSARQMTEVTLPPGAADLPAIQQAIGDALTPVLHGFPDAQTTLLRERLLDATAQAFHEELARDADAWRLYHGWLMARLLQQSQALAQVFAAHPTARTMLTDPDALADRLDAFTARVAALLADARPTVDQSGQTGGNSAGAFNTFQGDVQLGDTHGPTVGHVTAARDAYTAMIQLFFTGDLGEDGERLLSDYLDGVIRACQDVQLSRLTRQYQSGAEESSTPGVRLQDVYTSLTTDAPDVPVGRPHTLPATRVRAILERYFRQDRSAETQSPERVRGLGLSNAAFISGARGHRSVYTRMDTPLRWVMTAAPGQIQPVLDSDAAILLNLDELPPDHPLIIQVLRPELVLDAIREHPRLVLLGEPGSGKSTVLRYLALALAQRLRGHVVTIPHWPDTLAPVPIYLPLGQVAARAEAHAGDMTAALRQAIATALEGTQGLTTGLRRFLTPALRTGGVILLCDGLDELPTVPDADGRTVRSRVAAAIRGLAGESAARIVVTSRVLPYRAPGDWQLTSDQGGWVTRTIRRLAFGQVRTFVQHWYQALADEPRLAQEDPAAWADDLLTQLDDRPRVRPLTESPLLLTMLAILHFNTDRQIPDDRAHLYEECITLVLDRWEPRHSMTGRIPGLLERLGSIPGLTLDHLRTALHELAFKAHDQPPGDDGRGLLDRDGFEGRMLRLLRQFDGPDPAGCVATLTTVLRESAGLLEERGDHAYAFPHLTFQEYLAACYLADQGDPQTMQGLARERWHGPDGARWREVLALLAGRLRWQGAKAQIRDGLPWVQSLAAAKHGTAPKPAPERRWDALLAAISYRELGGRSAGATSNLDRATYLEQPLREALVALLAVPDRRIAPVDRIDAARLLGELGDPRVPVTPTAWRTRTRCTTPPTRFGGSSGYWCPIPAGQYPIGGWDDDNESATLELPAFWIARFPITVAQYRVFIESGGYATEYWWTSTGWQWRGQHNRMQPYRWDDPQFAQPNQPVTGVTWYEATAFCAWLHAQVADRLPPGYVVRLPTEAEWEVAASWGGRTRRAYPWGNTPESDGERAIFDVLDLNAPAPVGCCPAGAATCGALDMVGNVWEVCTSRYTTYSAGAQTGEYGFLPVEWDVPSRGGAYYSDSTSVCCGVRNLNFSGDIHQSYGMRVVVARSLADDRPGIPGVTNESAR